MEIAGKIALVTGAAAGIGRATSIMLAERGAKRVLLCDIDEHGLAESERLTNLAGAEAMVHRLDVTDSDAFEATFEKHGADGIDIVFNNAGIVSGPPPYPGTPIKRIEQLVAINLTSVIVGTTLAIAHMRARGIRGAIVNTSSIGGTAPYLDDAPYAASKAGVIMFTQSCKELFDSDGIRVNAVLPGVTETAILEKLGGGERPHWLMPMLKGIKVMPPSDIARVVCSLIDDENLAGHCQQVMNPAAESSD